MKPEAQRIAIAEACGTHTAKREMRAWNHGTPPEPMTVLTDCNGRVQLIWDYASSTDYDFIFPADYLNDLNAMHEAEKALNGRQRAVFEHILLHDVLKRPEPFTFDRGDIFAVITSTAAQRAEAFLKTIGKWTT